MKPLAERIKQWEEKLQKIELKKLKLFEKENHIRGKLQRLQNKLSTQEKKHENPV